MKDESAEEIYEFVKNVKAAGFKNALILGMGGSSLAPEVFSLIFGTEEKPLDVFVLDSTHPEAVKKYAEKLNPKETLYIVSTKSGGTVETLSFMKFSCMLSESNEKENPLHSLKKSWIRSLPFLNLYLRLYPVKKMIIYPIQK